MSLLTSESPYTFSTIGLLPSPLINPTRAVEPGVMSGTSPK